MILDGHIHLGTAEADPAAMLAQMQAAGVDGGVIISRAPSSFRPGTDAPAKDRLEQLMRFVEGHQELYPLFWIDPLDKDAKEQVSQAAKAGVAGFKVICDRFYAGEPRPLEVFQAIAKAGKPILFHSGILWDGKDSSRFNRPAEFEALLEVNGLRFSLAHISWPWCDEAIAVYGKFLNAYASNPSYTGEMYIDVTPGTPEFYRREALAKVFGVGYDVAGRLIFGTDSSAESYNAEWAKRWIDGDRAIYRDLGIVEEVQESIFSRNLQRFLGIASDEQKPRPVKVGE